MYWSYIFTCLEWAPIICLPVQNGPPYSYFTENLFRLGPPDFHANFLVSRGPNLSSFVGMIVLCHCVGD